MHVTELTLDAFRRNIYDYEKNAGEWKYEGDKPALIDFYATWCGPCRTMAPVVDRIGEEYAGRLDVYKVDVDKEQQLAALFGVRSIPAFIFIPRQGAPKHANGAIGYDRLKRIIEDNLLQTV